jgi:hypothetical protein
MGAEFIGTFIERPTRTKDEALAALATLNDSLIQHRYDEAFREEAPAPALARQALRDIVIEFYDTIVNGERRDVDVWIVQDQPILVTGGMTWGDDPTEAYQIIETMRSLAVTS